MKWGALLKSFENSSLLLKGVSETIQNDANEQNGGFLSMLLGTLSASLLGNILAGKGVIAKSVSEETKSKRQGWELNRAGEGSVRAGYGSNSWSKKNKFSFSSSSVDEYWNKKVLSKLT